MNDVDLLPARSGREAGRAGPLGLEVVELGRASPTRGRPGIDPVAATWVDVLHVAPARATVVLAECPEHVESTALMRFRSGAHAVAGLDLPPALMLQRMDEFARECRLGFPVSMVYAVVDAVRSTIRLACAGAPPPLLLLADEVTPIPVAVGPPVGLGAVPISAEEQLLPDEAVIAFTTSPGLAAGPESVSIIREVATVLESRRECSLSDMVDDLMATARRHAAPAPITLVRREGDPRLAAHWQLPGSTKSATLGRHLVDGALAEWPGSTADTRHDVRLVATELLSRVLATAPGAVTLRLALTRDGVLLEAHGGVDLPAMAPTPIDTGHTLVSDLSTRRGQRWESAQVAWAQLPWSSVAPTAGMIVGAVGAVGAVGVAGA